LKKVRQKREDPQYLPGKKKRKKERTVNQREKKRDHQKKNPIACKREEAVFFSHRGFPSRSARRGRKLLCQGESGEGVKVSSEERTLLTGGKKKEILQRGE